MDLVTRLEHVADRTWPALHAEWYDGWLLRFAAGVTGRSNSATPLRPGLDPLDSKVAHVVGRYREEGIAPMFRLTPLADAGLEELLASRGWVERTGADVMTRPVDGPWAADPAVALAEGTPPRSWLGALSALGDDRGRPAVMEHILAAIDGPVAYASIAADTGTAAIGMAAVADGIVAVYNMATAPAARRRGLGRRLLSGLLAWGSAQGATEAMLQVRPDNPAARALYRSAGFSLAYRYTYRRLDDDR